MISIQKEKAIDDILDFYLKNGSDKKTLIEIRNKIIKNLENSNDKQPIEIIYSAIDELIEASLEFLESKNLKGIDIIQGLSTSIYIPGLLSDNDLSILLYGGKTNAGGFDITPSTPFDVASITKFYTLVLKDKLAEFGILSDNEKISDIINNFGDMKDFTLNDLSLLCGELRTKGDIAKAKTKDEAYKILKTLYVYSNDRTVNKYNDFGAILTAIVITKKYNQAMGTNLTYDQILKKIILEPFNLTNTMFNPNTVVAGNGNLENLVHDPKTRILGGISGAAGLFTTSIDQMKFAKAVFEGNNMFYDPIIFPISPENIAKYGTITFPNSAQSNKGHFGLYQKNKEHNKSLCPRDYSDGSFTSQGYTGSSMIFDPINKIHNTIFVSAINQEFEKYKNLENFKDYITNDKANGFIEKEHTYQDIVTKNSLIINTIKKIIDQEYTKEDNRLDIKIKIK